MMCTADCGSDLINNDRRNILRFNNSLKALLNNIICLGIQHPLLWSDRRA